MTLRLFFKRQTIGIPHPQYFLPLLVCLGIIFWQTPAFPFPFQGFEEHAPVPAATLSRLEDASALPLQSLKGKPYIAVFWGADLPEKRVRSVKTLAAVEQLMYFFKERQITLLSVNVQGDDPEIINEVLSSAKSNIPVYTDKDGRAYGALGVYVIPSILLVDKDGRAQGGMGYSHDAVDRLKGAVEIMLGEKTAEQVAAALRPEVKEISEEEKAVSLHMNYGMVLLKRGLNDAAVREFEKAVEAKPDFAEAHIELGCLLDERGELERAREEITKGLALDSDNLAGLLCRAALLADEGRFDESVAELTEIVKSHPDNSKALYSLGRGLEAKKETVSAMHSYREAYLLLLNNAR